MNVESLKKANLVLASINGLKQVNGLYDRIPDLTPDERKALKAANDAIIARMEKKLESIK